MQDERAFLGRGGAGWWRWPCPLTNHARLPLQEIARLLALEEATLSTDLQQGYALKSLTGRGSLLALPLAYPAARLGADLSFLGC